MVVDNYRKGSAVFLLNPDNKNFFAAERIDIPGAWQIPQGGVENDETHLEAAIRELYEETGIRSIQLLKNTSNLYKYDFPEDIKLKFAEKFAEKTCLPYKGQEMRFFLFKFLGDDSEVNLGRMQQREFSNWRWMSIDNILNFSVEFKKKAYKSAAAELGLCQ